MDNKKRIIELISQYTKGNAPIDLVAEEIDSLYKEEENLSYNDVVQYKNRAYYYKGEFIDKIGLSDSESKVCRIFRVELNEVTLIRKAK